MVEDDPDTRHALVERLRAEGYEVTAAANGADALNALADSPVPCLILLDYAMPVMDGRAFREAQQCNARWTHIPVVLITAHALTSFAARSIDAAAVLQKPVHYEDLAPLLNRYCAR